LFQYEYSSARLPFICPQGREQAVQKSQEKPYWHSPQTIYLTEAICSSFRLICIFGAEILFFLVQKPTDYAIIMTVNVCLQFQNDICFVLFPYHNRATALYFSGRWKEEGWITNGYGYDAALSRIEKTAAEKTVFPHE
jgi:hypothetical protein